MNENLLKELQSQFIKEISRHHDNLGEGFRCEHCDTEFESDKDKCPVCGQTDYIKVYDKCVVCDELYKESDGNSPQSGFCSEECLLDGLDFIYQEMDEDLLFCLIHYYKNKKKKR